MQAQVVSETTINVISLSTPYSPNYNYNEPPPTYDDVTNPDAPPPTYNAVANLLRDTDSSKSSPLELLRTTVRIFLTAIACVLLPAIIPIPYFMALMGLLYINECPVQKYIPIYLQVAGFCGVVQELLAIRNRWKTSREEIPEQSENSNDNGWDIPIEQIILSLFMFAWFSAGSFWIYQEYEPSFDPMSGAKYCNQSIYGFAFWLNTSVYICIGVISTLFAALGCINIIQIYKN